MDNQQQQQTTVFAGRSVGELLVLMVGGAVVGLLFVKGLHWAAPEVFPPSS